jgi:hypothetical protein
MPRFTAKKSNFLKKSICEFMKNMFFGAETGQMRGNSTASCEGVKLGSTGGVLVSSKKLGLCSVAPASFLAVSSHHNDDEAGTCPRKYLQETKRIMIACWRCPKTLTESILHDDGLNLAAIVSQI